MVYICSTHLKKIYKSQRGKIQNSQFMEGEIVNIDGFKWSV